MSFLPVSEFTYMPLDRTTCSLINEEQESGYFLVHRVSNSSHQVFEDIALLWGGILGTCPICGEKITNIQVEHSVIDEEELEDAFSDDSDMDCSNNELLMFKSIIENQTFLNDEELNKEQFVSLLNYLESYRLIDEFDKDRIPSGRDLIRLINNSGIKMFEEFHERFSEIINS